MGHYVKEYGEGIDRIYRELEANGTSALSFRTDDFILKITVPKVTESELNRTEKETESRTDKDAKRTESELNRTENGKGMTGKVDRLIENTLSNGRS